MAVRRFDARPGVRRPTDPESFKLSGAYLSFAPFAPLREDHFWIRTPGSAAVLRRLDFFVRTSGLVYLARFAQAAKIAKGERVVDR